MRRHFSPASLRPPFGRYHQAVQVGAPSELLALSGLLGLRLDGSVPEDVGEQATLIFAGIDACLAEAGMGREHVLRLTTFLTDLADRPAYMAARDAWAPEPPPASTLVVVKALVVPGCRVEVEALAARGR